MHVATISVAQLDDGRVSIDCVPNIDELPPCEASRITMQMLSRIREDPAFVLTYERKRAQPGALSGETHLRLVH